MYNVCMKYSKLSKTLFKYSVWDYSSAHLPRNTRHFILSKRKLHIPNKIKVQYNLYEYTHITTW